MGAMIKDSTTLEILVQLNKRFDKDSLPEMIELQKEFAVFSSKRSLQQAFALLGIVPTDWSERRRWYKFLDHLKKYPSDLPKINGHDRVIKAFRDGLAAEKPIPISIKCHSAAEDPRVTVAKGRPVVFTIETHLIVSIPTTPGREVRKQAAEVAELKAYPRTPKTNSDAFFWEYAVGGLRNYQFWNAHIGRLHFEYRLDANAPRTARAYAIQRVAVYDTAIACWDAKYAYWLIRPVQLDPNVKPLFPTPNHPSYPAAHGCFSLAAATSLGRLFPRVVLVLAGRHLQPVIHGFDPLDAQRHLLGKLLRCARRHLADEDRRRPVDRHLDSEGSIAALFEQQFLDLDLFCIILVLLALLFLSGAARGS